MADNRSNRRREVIVDADAQAPMMIRWIFIPLAMLTMGAIAMLAVAHATFTELEKLGGSAPPFSGLVVGTVVFVVAVCATVTLLALQQSHRIVGPAQKLEQSIERMRNGDLDFEVTLREGDELTAVAHELNRLLAAMRERAAADEVGDVPADTRETESVASA